jgi:DNA polymerase-3 subunit alpha
MSAIKGVGGNAVEEIVAERKKGGKFSSIFNLTERVDLRTVNKRSLEALVISGGFDCFDDYTRAQYFNTDPNDKMTIFEKAVKYGQRVKDANNSAQQSLFGGTSDEKVPIPKVAKCEDWNEIEKLNKEKELIGIYISGHPLDMYKLEIKSYANSNTTQIIPENKSAIKIGGIISATSTRFTKKGNKFCNFTIDDYNGSFEIFLFGKDFLEFGNMVSEIGSMVFLEGQYQARRYNENEFEFKVGKITLLDDLRKEICTGIRFFMNLEDINEQIIQSMKAVFTKYPGDYTGNFSVRDVKEKIKLEFFSREFKLDLSHDMLDELGLITGLNYKLV